MQPLFDSKAQYLLLCTVDTDKCQPWQTVPIVYVKLSNGEALPKNVKEYDECEYIQIGFTHYENRFYPLSGGNDKELIAERSKVKCEVNEYGVLPEYRVKLRSTCKRVIPKSLIYVGNFADAVPPKQEFVPFSKRISEPNVGAKTEENLKIACSKCIMNITYMNWRYTRIRRF